MWFDYNYMRTRVTLNSVLCTTVPKETPVATTVSTKAKTSLAKSEPN